MENFKEEWRPVVGYEGFYEVSNTGKVDSINFHREGYRARLKTQIIKGYVRVSLLKKSKVKHFFLHRLVAEAFIPNPNNLPFINHKDENKLNNRVDNLEWCTASYNNNYGSIKQKISEKKGVPVIQLTLDGKFVARYKSLREAAAKTGAQLSSISAVCLGKLLKTHGYKWRYEDDEKDEKKYVLRNKIEQYTHSKVKKHNNIFPVI